MVLSKRGWGKALAGAIVMVAGLVTFVVAEEDQASSPSDAPSAATEQVEAPVAQPASLADNGVIETSPGNITMDFKDADINNVLRILSYKSGVNIVTGKDVQGLVTIRLTDVPWEKALDVILRTYGFAYEREGNIIRVTTVENLEKEELSTEVFVLNYAKASEVIESVRDILSERGRVRFDERTNVLIVTDIPTNLYKISQVVKRLDKRTPQVAIDAKVVETTLGNDDTLGIDWHVQVSGTGAGRPTTFPFTQKSGLGRTFAPQGQTSAETSTSVTSGGGTASSTSTAFPRVFGYPFADKGLYKFGTLSFDQFSTLVQYLESRRNTRILSNPRITTLNNQTANILVGEVLGIPIFERNENTGNIEITGYTEKDLGIKLSVTPHVNDEGMILVELKPEISSLLGFDELTPQVRAPRFATREAETQVLVKDGDTIAIGGLVSEKKVDSVRKVPLLGDVPGLGYLFSQKTNTKEKTDLLFFVTVHIVTDEDIQEAKVTTEKLDEKSVEPGKAAKPSSPKKSQKAQEGFLEEKKPSPSGTP